MNKMLLAVLILTALAAGMTGGWLARDRLVIEDSGKQSGFNPPTPTPAPDENIASQNGRVAAYDGQTLTVKLDGGEEISFEDLSNAGVWTVAGGAGSSGQPTRSDWEAVEVGKRVTVSFDRTDKQLLGVLIYTE